MHAANERGIWVKNRLKIVCPGIEEKNAGLLKGFIVTVWDPAVLYFLFRVT